MSIEKEIIILAKSKKYNNYCIAGYDINENQLIRIISGNPRIHFSVPGNDIVLSNTNAEAGLLDVVRLKAKKIQPNKENPHQVENWEYDNRFKWQKIKSIDIHQIPSTSYSTDQNLFYNTKHILNKQEMGLIKNDHKSLQFIEPSFLEFYIKEYEGTTKIYANLRWNNQVYKRLALTDPHYVSQIEEKYRNDKKEFFFVTHNPLVLVSLSGIFEHDMCYYKLIASIVSPSESKVCPKNTLFFPSYKALKTSE